MTTHTADSALLRHTGTQRLRATGQQRHLLVLRLVAGLPLLAIGMAHVVVADAPLQPLVEAAGFPLPGLVAAVGVLVELAAGVSVMLGLWARVGAAAAIPVMLGAVYAHLVIDVWPNGPQNEPPLALPILVALAAAAVLWRGAGRWSLDHRATPR